MAAVEMAAGVNLGEACASRARDLRIWTADVHRSDPHAVEGNLLQLRLRLLELLLQLRDPLGRGVGRRRERSDRFRFQGRIRSVIARGESFEDAGDGYCDVVVPGRQLQPELEGLPSEVLTIEIESRGTFEVEHLRLHLHVIDP